ncbi:transport protein [Klebsiella michiganensis]|nr:transport protein [Klebsiella michiganensis]
MIRKTVFLLGALLAMLWLLVASTMSEPPYVSSLRVEIPEDIAADKMLEAAYGLKRASKRCW